MAIIGKIRKQSGFVIVIVGIALAAFVLGDFVRKSPKSSNLVGKIAGENITFNEFNQKAEEQIQMMKDRSKKENLTSEEVFQAKEMTWNQMLTEMVMGREYDKLGLTVSTDELFDQVQGKNPHPYILQYFKDPKTGQYNPSLVLNFLKTMDQREPEVKKQWMLLEKAIKDDRIKTKFNNLIVKGYYYPKALLQKSYEEMNRTGDFRMVTESFFTIPDSTIQLTDQDYQKYYDENKTRYDQEASRDLDYVQFDIVPSKDDLAKIQKDVYDTYTEFQNSTDVPNFVNANSDAKFDSTFHKKGTLPVQIDSLMFSSEAGTFVPPYIDDKTYFMAKLLDVQMRPDSMKASHILIAYQGAMNASEKLKRTKEQARKTADSLLVVLKKTPALFGDLAAKMSDDPSVKDKKGDLGWFADQMMVKPFNDACLKGKVGDIDLVETAFGYHLINITGKTEALKKVKVAIVSRLIEASGQTVQSIFNTASAFAGENNTITSFEASAKARKLNVRSQQYIRPMDPGLPGTKNSRGVIMWAFFDKTKKGSVSQVMEAEGTYIVAALKEIREKGIPPLEQIKKNIEPLIKREKKADIIVKKLDAALGSGDINAVAQKLNARVDTLTNLTFASYNLPKVGPEPKIVGNLFQLKAGALSKPIKGDNVAVVVFPDKFTEPPATKDYTMVKMQLDNNFRQRVNQYVEKALEKTANITDNRYKFY